MSKFFRSSFAATILLVLSLFAFVAHGSGWSPDNYTETGLPGEGGSIQGIIENLADWFLVIIGTVAIIAFIISGVIYLTSAGDDGRMEKAKEAMIASIIGIIVALSGYVVIKAAHKFLDAGFF